MSGVHRGAFCQRQGGGRCKEASIRGFQDMVVTREEREAAFSLD